MQPFPPLTTYTPDYWQALGVLLHLSVMDPDRQAMSVGETLLWIEDRLAHCRVSVTCNAMDQPVLDMPVACRRDALD